MGDPKARELELDEADGFTTFSDYCEDLDAEDTDAKIKLSDEVKRMRERQEESDRKAGEALKRTQRTTRALQAPSKNGRNGEP